MNADNAFDGAAGFWVGIIVGVAVASIMIAVRLVLLLRQPIRPASHLTTTYDTPVVASPQACRFAAIAS